MAIFPTFSQMPKHSYPLNAHPKYSLVGIYEAIVSKIHAINGILMAAIGKVDGVSRTDIKKIDGIEN